MCRAFDGGSLFVALIRRKFSKVFLISVLQFEKLMETGSLSLGPLYSNSLNLLFWAINMPPNTICPWSGCANEDKARQTYKASC